MATLIGVPPDRKSEALSRLTSKLRAPVPPFPGNATPPGPRPRRPLSPSLPGSKGRSLQAPARFGSPPERIFFQTLPSAGSGDRGGLAGKSPNPPREPPASLFSRKEKLRRRRNRSRHTPPGER